MVSSKPSPVLSGLTLNCSSFTPTRSRLLAKNNTDTVTSKPRESSAIAKQPQQPVCIRVLCICIVHVHALSCPARVFFFPYHKRVRFANLMPQSDLSRGRYRSMDFCAAASAIISSLAIAIRALYKSDVTSTLHACVLHVYCMSCVLSWVRLRVRLRVSLRLSL